MRTAQSFIGILAQLYVDQEYRNDAENHLLLRAVNHFGWVAKRQTLDHLFTSQMEAIKDSLFNGEDTRVSATKTREIDIVISLLERVKLTPEMASAVLLFAEALTAGNKSVSKYTAKQGFKILGLIMQRYWATVSSEKYEDFRSIFLTAEGLSQSAGRKHKLSLLESMMRKVQVPKTEDVDMADGEQASDDEEEARIIDISGSEDLLIQDVLPSLLVMDANLKEKKL